MFCMPVPGASAVLLRGCYTILVCLGALPHCCHLPCVAEIGYGRALNCPACDTPWVCCVEQPGSSQFVRYAPLPYKFLVTILLGAGQGRHAICRGSHNLTEGSAMAVRLYPTLHHASTVTLLFVLRK